VTPDLVEPPRIEVRLLGSVEVRLGGRRCPLGGRNERAVLALLAIRPGRVVHLDWLVDQLWNGRPPRSAANTLQSYLSRLRTRLGTMGRAVIRRDGRGYVLGGPVHVDATEFTGICERVARARVGSEYGRAHIHARQALSLWRGVPFLGIDDVEALDGERRRLVELRAEAVLDSTEAAVALGDTVDAGVLADLDELTLLYPWRERPWHVKSLALQGLGRYADAVACVGSAIASLRDQKGLEPPALLLDLERRLLQHAYPLHPHGGPRVLAGTVPTIGSLNATPNAARRADMLGAPWDSTTMNLAYDIAHRLRGSRAVAGLRSKPSLRTSQSGIAGGVTVDAPLEAPVVLVHIIRCDCDTRPVAGYHPTAKEPEPAPARAMSP
jgi:DNA-binding SARP family transcriptional activator